MAASPDVCHALHDVPMIVVNCALFPLNCRSQQAQQAFPHEAGTGYRLSSESLAQEPKNERPVVVAGKDQGEVDNDYLLIPVNILDHEGPLSAAFPVENRLLPQGEHIELCPEGAQLKALVIPMAATCRLHGRLGMQGALICAGCSYLI